MERLPKHVVASAQLVASTSLAFAIIFGIFVVALLVLIVITLMWAYRRDKAGRVLWRQRQQERAAPGEGDVPPTRRP
jgi:uncharacterized membrane protein YadS